MVADEVLEVDRAVLVQALLDAGVGGHRELAVWRVAPTALRDRLGELGGGLDASKVELACLAAHELEQRIYHWHQNYKFIVSLADLVEGWLIGAADSEHIGRRVELILDDDDVQRGSVIAYLPPTAEEPMALWKVKLDDEDDNFADLEQEELLAALLN